MKKTLILFAVVCLHTAVFGQSLFVPLKNLETLSLDSVTVIHRGYDSLAIVRHFGAGTSAIAQTTFYNGITPPSVSSPISISGAVIDTVGMGGLMAGSVYTINTVFIQGTLIDSIVIVDSTLSSPPSPLDVGPTIVVSNTTSYSALLTVPFNRNGGGTVFMTWQDSTSGGQWNFLTTHQVVGTNDLGNDTLTVFQSPATTRWYRAIGFNQMFPLFLDTSLHAVVTTPALLANPPSFDTISVSNITDQGGVVTVTLSADSIGGVVFVQIVCGGQTYSLPPQAYSAGTSSLNFLVTVCGPLDSVTVNVQIISSNPAWTTVYGSTGFSTASGLYEISITNCYSVGQTGMVDILYSTGGYGNNSMYLLAFLPNDLNNAIAFSQIYSGLPSALGGTYTMMIMSGLMPSTTYVVKAYIFNQLGQMDDMCTLTMPGTTSVDENEKNSTKIFFDGENSAIHFSGFGNETLSVYDLQGRCLHSSDIQSNGSYNVDLVSGVYIANIGTRSMQFFVK
ncbi:MAG: T9SS type A sorting domain-containing protein [Candidatus Pacebacteria bacterium]|nr:T9SS type A sorting domain-containing protein [Candidatus Paceibacterota bacterium]MBP9780561.1 T9SS type A sorting domain-containing protein [Candidatus Paceibacterota bacterium]